MKSLLPLLIIVVFIVVMLLLTGCATEYYEPQSSTGVTKIDGKLYGPVKREGFLPWSNGIGKNLPLANPSFSVVNAAE